MIVEIDSKSWSSKVVTEVKLQDIGGDDGLRLSSPRHPSTPLPVLKYVYKYVKKEEVNYVTKLFDDFFSIFLVLIIFSKY